MATIEPLVKRLKKSKKKKIVFEIPEEDSNENKVSEENKPLINVSEFENNSNINGINWLSHSLNISLNLNYKSIYYGNNIKWIIDTIVDTFWHLLKLDASGGHH